MDRSRDPGWRPALRYALFGLLPGWSLRRRRRAGHFDGLILLRGIFLSFTSGLLLVGLVVVVLDASAGLDRSVSEAPVAAFVLVIGVASLTPPLWERPLACDDDARLAKSYTTRFFLRVALTETPALLAFAGFILTAAGWLYAMGGVFTAIGLWRLAPTAAHLDDDQQRLRASGCGRSLVDALRNQPLGGRGG